MKHSSIVRYHQIEKEKGSFSTFDFRLAACGRLRMKAFAWLGALPFFALLLFASCKEKAAEANEEKPKVKIETAEQKAVDQLVTFTANVQGEAVNSITPAVPARIKKIRVDVGDRVSRGQRLVEMDPTGLDQQWVQLEKLERDYQRYQELYEAGGISQQQLEQMKVQLDVHRAVISNLKENTTLVSPIDGIVTARHYDDGDVFAQTPILVVQQLNPVKALINVSEVYFPKIKTGMKVEVNLDVYGADVFEGRIRLVHPTIDPNSHTFVCEVAINNQRLLVRPGMFARVTLNFGKEDRVLVSDQAVIKQSGSNDRFVYVLVDGKAVYKQVNVGQRVGDRWEVISGVEPGEVVVVAGQSRLVNGSEVEIIKD